MSGTLYGVGVGPGAPDLLTLRADRLIRSARVVAYPAPDTGPSLARQIAADAIPKDAIEIPMIVPMRTERFPAQDVYSNAASEISGHLTVGTDVVVLCEGDPFFFGSFMYLFARLADSHPVEIVPGVSSLGACAAAIRWPLVARNDVMSVIPATLPDDALRTGIRGADAVALMKVGRHLPRVRALIETMGLTQHSGYIARATLSNEVACSLSDAPDTAPYFSMILISKGEDPWLSQHPPFSA